MTSPAGGRLGAAFVRIRADVSRFAADARRGLQNGLNAAAARLNSSSIIAALRRAGILGGQALGNGVYRDANGRLRDLRGRFVAEGALAGHAYAAAFNKTADLDGRGLINLTFLMNKWVAAGLAAAKFLPQVIALVGELGQVGVAAAASLPFLITSLLVIKETFNNAFKGVGDAISAAFDKDPSKLQAALKDLTPSARAFVLEIAKVAPILEKTQKAIQESFFEPLKGSFTALAKSPFFKDLGEAMRTIANEAGFVASQILAAFTASAASGQFKVILAQVVQLFVTLSTIFAPLTTTFLNLAAAAGPFVNLLAGKLADKVIAWFDSVNAAIASGDLGRGFDSAVSTLGNLFHLLGDLGSILGSIFGALSADGESVIATIGGLTAQFAEFLKSTAGIQALTAIADVLHLIGSTITLLLTPVLPILAQLITAVGGPLVGALEKLGPPIAKVIDAFAKVLAPLIEVLTPVIEQLTTILADTLAEVLILIADEIYELLPSIVELFQALGPSAVLLVKALGEVLVALVPLFPAWFEAIEELIPVMIDLLPLIVFGAEVLAGLVLIVAQLVEWLVPLVGWLAKLGAQFVGFVFTDFIDALVSVVDWVQNVYEAIDNFFGRQLPEFLDGGEKRFVQFKDAIGQLPALITAALGDLFNAIVGPFTVGFGGANTAVSSGIGGLVDKVKSIPGALGSFVGSIGAAAANIGRAIGNGIANIPGFAAEIGSKVVARIKQFANNVIYGINQGIYRLSQVLPFNLPYIPYLAKGAIIDQPTMAVLGEAGKEVVIPLTDPARARQLAAESGLLDMLGNGIGGQPVTYVYVYVGDEEITDRIDVRVDRAIGEQAREMTYGNRGI